MKPKLTQDFLKESVSYDKETGEFSRKQRPISHFKNARSMNSSNAKFANSPCGAITKGGYISINVGGFSYLAHRLAWLYVYGNFPNNGMDHINSVKIDNRISNLRECTQAENMQNLKNPKAENKCGFLGVHKVRNHKFRALIVCGSIRKHLGYFRTPEEAHLAYISEKRKLHDFNEL